jgi:catechol 2,3-dioxygenase-like lactoylglutathione lyase family enzyme
MTGIARFSLVALDCPDAGALAAFYGRITGWPVRDDETEGDWIELASPGGATIAFQQVEDHRPPVWPGSEHPQQIHLDFDVLDLDEGEAAVLALGARKAEHQPGTTFRVFLDPAGHPFCLVLDHSMRTS